MNTFTTLLLICCLGLLEFIDFLPLPSSLICNSEVGCGKYKFMHYFDDKYNFIEYPQFNNFAPYTWSHLRSILTHIGINVYEPVGNLFKAVSITLVGIEPQTLRVVTLLLHTVNAVLLYMWLVMLFQNVLPLDAATRKSSLSIYSRPADDTQSVVFYGTSRLGRWRSFFVGAVCAIFFVHPLNVEIIGWLSAQNYALSLCFSLLGSILVEDLIAKQFRSPQKDQINASSDTAPLLTRVLKTTMPHEAAIILLYLCSCFSKAPAVVTPLVFVLRVITAGGGTTTTTTIDAANSSQRPCFRNLFHYWRVHWSFILRFIVTQAAATVCVLLAVVRANSNSGSLIPAYSTWDGIAIRAMVTISDFVRRIFVPCDLRGHYRVGEEGEFRFSSLLSAALAMGQGQEQADTSLLYYLKHRYNNSNGTGGSGSTVLLSKYLLDTDNTTTGNNGVGSVSVMVSSADATVKLFSCFLLVSVTTIAIGALLLPPPTASIPPLQKRGTTGSHSSGVVVRHGVHALAAFGWLSYLIMWLPGCGIVSHGWAQRGADRYNYFPLAYLSPAAVAMLLSISGSDDDDEDDADADGDGDDKEEEAVSAKVVMCASDTAAENSKKSKEKKLVSDNNKRNTTKAAVVSVSIINRWAVLGRRSLVLSACLIFIACLCVTSRRQLLTWRDDKSLLLNCISHDPYDYDCHQFLGDFYGFHEDNDTMGSRHKDLAAQLVPSTNPKALMFKAKILVFMNKHDDACEVMDYTYDKFYRDKIERRTTAAAAVDDANNSAPLGESKIAPGSDPSSGASYGDVTAGGKYQLLRMSTSAGTSRKRKHRPRAAAASSSSSSSSSSSASPVTVRYRSNVFSRYADVLRNNDKKSSPSSSSNTDNTSTGTSSHTDDEPRGTGSTATSSTNSINSNRGGADTSKEDVVRILSFDKLSSFERSQYPSVLNNWLLCEALRRGIGGLADKGFISNATLLMEEAMDLMVQIPSMQKKQLQQELVFPTGTEDKSQRNKKGSHSDNVLRVDYKTEFSTQLFREIELHLLTLRKWRAGKGEGRYDATFIW